MDPRATFRLDARFTHLVTWENGGVVVGDEDFVLLHDRVVFDVLALATEPMTEAQVVADLGHHDARHVSFVVLSLEAEGVLTTDDSAPEGPGGSVDPLARRLADAWAARDSPVVVLDSEMGGADDELSTILTDDYLHPGVAERVAAEHAAGRKLSLARVAAQSAWVGPWLPVDGSCCFDCMIARLQLNAPARTLLYRHDDGPGPETEVKHLGRKLGLGAFERLASALSSVGTARQHSSSVTRVNKDGATTHHPVPSRPDCSRCGGPEVHRAGDRLELRSRAKVTGSFNGSRVTATGETLRRVAKHVDPLLGIVRGVRPVPIPLLTGVHGYTATHAQHYGRATPADLLEESRDHSGGKGSSDLDARVSAICESLERHSAVHRGSEATRLARASELGDAAVSPGALLCVSEGQYEEREAWNAAHGDGFQWIPQRYEDEPIEWSPVRSLVSAGRKWIPSGHLFLGFRGRGRQFCVGDSNGLAAGNCFEEAVLQGLLELIERDAIALWWYNRVRRPGVDIVALDDPWCQDVLQQFESAGRDVWALDLTHDLGIPVVAAVTAEAGRHIAMGFGAHPDLRIAVRRALSEAGQMLGSLLAEGSEPRGSLEAQYPDAVAWWRGATLESEPYLEPRDEGLAAGGDGGAGVEAPDLLDDLARCLSSLVDADIDVLVHDLTRPDVAFPVVRVVAPGLRHFWRRLGPGRLYDVPVQLAWLPRALEESELNPRSVFL